MSLVGTAVAGRKTSLTGRRDAGSFFDAREKLMCHSVSGPSWMRSFIHHAKTSLRSDILHVECNETPPRLDASNEATEQALTSPR